MKTLSKSIFAFFACVMLALAGCGGGGGDSSAPTAANCGYSDQLTPQIRAAANLSATCYTQVDLADNFLASAISACATRNFAQGDSTYVQYTLQAKRATDVTNQFCAPVQTTPGAFYLLVYSDASSTPISSICTRDANYQFVNTGGTSRQVASGISFESCAALQARL